MPRINGWVKTKDTRNLKQWVNNKTDSVLTVKDNKIIIEAGPNGNPEINNIESWPSHTEALSNASFYMKVHPSEDPIPTYIHNYLKSPPDVVLARVIRRGGWEVDDIAQDVLRWNASLDDYDGPGEELNDNIRSMKLFADALKDIGEVRAANYVRDHMKRRLKEAKTNYEQSIAGYKKRRK